MRFLARYALLATILLAAALAPAMAVDRVDEFNRAKRELQQQLRSKQPADRLAALKRLQDFPIADAVRLIHNCLGDSSDEVSQQAYESLLKLCDKQEVCETLLLMSRKTIHRKDDGQAVAPLLAVLLSSTLPSVQRDTREFLDTVAASKGGVQIPLTLADELGRHGAEYDVLPLLRLSECKCFANYYGVRRAVVQSLAQIPHAAAVGAQIQLLSKVEGEAQADAVEHLAHVSGQIFGRDTAAWQRWWEEAKETFEHPKSTATPPYRSIAIKVSGEYYGLPLFAERLVFVLDTSGSMTGQRIVAAKRELIRAIAGLPDDAHFGVVVFNGTVSAWQKQLVPATEAWKKAASRFVEMQGTLSNTASYDALEVALSYDTEAIYFLSDGAPQGGKITAPVDIIAAITEMNKTRRVSIYTIGIGAGFPGSPLDLFLKTLAEKNLGLYRRVDN